VTPIGTIESTPRSAFTTKLQQIIKETGVTTIVVGEAGLSSFGAAPGEVQIKLSQIFKLPVIVTEEHETTKQARAATGRHDHADTEAACQILERYIEEHDGQAN